MTTLRILTGCLVSTLWLGAASPRAQTPAAGAADAAPLVVVFAAEGESDARARAAFERGLVASLTHDVRPSRRAMRFSPGHDCAGAMTCYREAARAQQAQEFVVARWHEEDGRIHAVVARHLLSGEPVLESSRRGVGLDPARLSRELIIETFSPERFTGRLALVEVPDDVTQVWIDGVPLRQGEWRQPIELIAGAHRLDGYRADGSAFSLVVEVPFEQTLTHAFVPVAATPALRHPGPPVWPLTAAGAVSVIPLVAGGAFVVDALLTQSKVDNAATAQADALARGAGEVPARYTARIASAMTSSTLRHTRASVHTGLRTGVVALSLGAASGVVTGILWAARNAAAGGPQAEE